MEPESGKSLIDASRLMIEGAVAAGADVFVGYPITPANLLYSYSSTRFPVVLPAPDEISTLQWMSGFAAAGRLPVTATSYPGLALMMESLGMAFMMELPMVIMLVQRLGPSTGTATCGAQGDIALLNGINSGGHPVPTLCPSSFEDCYSLSAKAVHTAVDLRSPVILLSSKEMVMTLKSFDLSTLEPVHPVKREFYRGSEPYRPYHPADDGVPPFLPVGSREHQVRVTASTHNSLAALQHSTPEALANTKRLRTKTEQNLSRYTEFEYHKEDSDTLLFSYGISAAAAREAAGILRSRGKPVSLLTAKTLFPVPPEYLQAAADHSRVVVVEENQSGQYREVLFGKQGRSGVTGVNAIGRLIAPAEIVKEVPR
jgi:2-oxoglutarate/2-oxoacid ferredoxin oxidoreductase subunit alpha